VPALGQPGGKAVGRPPVVRLGKVLTINKPSAKNPQWYVQTDCPLIMGDSGGPVFDLNGNVVAINSRIGVRQTTNVHVPIDTYVDTWERLARGDEWGGGVLTRLGAIPSAPPSPAQAKAKAALSLTPSDEPNGIMVMGVRPDMASDRAGIMPQDIITKFDGAAVKTSEDLAAKMSKHKPGDVVTLELLRNAKPVQVKVTLDAADAK
jgi:serine protease Do